MAATRMQIECANERDLFGSFWQKIRTQHTHYFSVANAEDTKKRFCTPVNISASEIANHMERTTKRNALARQSASIKRANKETPVVWTDSYYRD